MEISLCITTRNRPELLIKSFEKVLNDDRITEVVILDDESEMWVYDRIFEAVRECPKIHLYRNAVNIGMGASKRKCISFASNKWCIIFDDDNTLDTPYLNALEEIGGLDPNIFYMPSRALPHFDYRDLAWDVLDLAFVKEHIESPCWNTCNMVVNRDRYLDVYEHPEADTAADTIWLNYLWLKAGGQFYVVPGMEYEHLVHPDSGFQKDMGRSLEQVGIIKAKILAL